MVGGVLAFAVIRSSGPYRLPGIDENAVGSHRHEPLGNRCALRGGPWCRPHSGRRWLGLDREHA